MARQVSNYSSLAPMFTCHVVRRQLGAEDVVTSAGLPAPPSRLTSSARRQTAAARHCCEGCVRHCCEGCVSGHNSPNHATSLG